MAWKANPKGVFVDWNPEASCEDFTEAAVRTSSAHRECHWRVTWRPVALRAPPAARE